MKIVLDLRKSAQENAAYYYERAKKLKEKAEGARDAIERTRGELKKLEGEKKTEIRIRRKREWYEKFHWFFSSDGFLVIGGRDAKQNESLHSRYFEENDLFMHADVIGAPFVIIKNGSTAPEKTLHEAAQFAANFSSAWKNGLGAVDVYSASKGQVSKHSQGEFVAKGGFVIRGERKWFRNTELGALIGVSASGVQCIPKRCGGSRFSSFVEIAPVGAKKGDIAKQLVALLPKDAKVAVEDVLPLLPPGESHLLKDR